MSFVLFSRVYICIYKYVYLVQSCGFFFNVTFVHVLHAWDSLSIYILDLGTSFLFLPFPFKIDASFF